MSSQDLLDRLFAVEGNDHVLTVLREAIERQGSAERCEFTFNVFDVSVDWGRRVVKIEDDLDPRLRCEVPIGEFALRLATEWADRHARSSEDL